MKPNVKPFVKTFLFIFHFRLLGLLPDISSMAVIRGYVKPYRNIFGNGYITVGAQLDPAPTTF
jgi:hypothetical protein